MEHTYLYNWPVISFDMIAHCLLFICKEGTPGQPFYAMLENQLKIMGCRVW